MYGAPMTERENGNISLRPKQGLKTVVKQVYRRFFRIIMSTREHDVSVESLFTMTSKTYLEINAIFSRGYFTRENTPEEYFDTDL